MEESRIEELLARYFDAATTDAEECELRDYFRCGEPLPERLRPLRTLFCGLDDLAGERLPQKRKPAVRMLHLSLRRRLLWGAAAAVAAAGIVVGALELRKPYCYIDGVAVYDRETAMRTTVYLSGLSELDAPMRMLDDLICNQ